MQTNLVDRNRLGTATVFAALGDPIRLAMLARLSDDGPLPTIEFSRRAGVSRQAITKHLQVLESAGLVRSERVGRDRRWRVHGERLAVARRHLEQISRQWDRRLENLRLFVEADGQ